MSNLWSLSRLDHLFRYLFCENALSHRCHCFFFYIYLAHILLILLFLFSPWENLANHKKKWSDLCVPRRDIFECMSFWVIH
ncbi:hypothetical protein NC652_024128 [Populus alba x Populus x berolinensis]|nr:hypothetical protein NC652_024128 [Populus alba x Populus x berolinensis]